MSVSLPDFSEQFRQATDFQSKAMEPMRLFGGLAIETAETMMRKNYALMGDVVDYTVKQAKLPLSGDSLSDVASAQVAEATAFTELLGTRANEYAEIANEFGTKAKSVAEEASALVKNA